jgi:hypothetical protein
MLAYSAPVTIQPQLTGLTGAATVSYTVNGVNWTVSASSNNAASQSAFKAFNNTTGDAWLSDNALQRYSAAGVVNANAATTSVIGVGTVAGEYLQVQSSVPIVMYSFALGLGLNPSPGNAPKTYYIIGSNDSVNWYTLQTGTTNITTLAGSSGYIIINQSGVQALSGTSSGNITTVAGAYATNPYTYFRLIGTSLINGGGSTYMEIGEWFINFTAGGQAYSTNFGSTWQNGYALATPSLSLSGSGQYAIGANTVVPQLTGLAANTWTVNGVNWTASASSNLSVDLPAYGAFNNYYGSIVPYSWGSVNNSYSASGVYQGGISTSILGGVGSKSGEWLQLQTSVPLVMYSYTFACGGNAGLPQNYWIIGSNDGTNWYPIQNAIMAANPFGNTNNGNNFATCTNYLLANSNATQTLTGSNGTGSGATTVNVTTTNYATSGNAYTYFRIISTVGFNPSSALFELGEWFINFAGGPQYTIVNNYLSGFGTGTATTGSVTGTITASAISTTGQYMALVTTNTSGANVYYSTNYGANFTGLTIGSTPMTTCAISADGSYITVSNGTTVYQLNNNSNGFSLALGNNAGVQNQGLNAIAIGNYAGQINQSANSIVLNASGSVINPVTQGFYVAPIVQYNTSPSTTFSLLAYGTDNQVVQSGIIISSQTSTQTLMQVTGTITTSAIAAATDLIAQGIYLTPSPANSATIIQYFQKVANTIAPNGTPPFWMNGYTYGTTGTTLGSSAYFGGVLLPDGRVVFVPYNATSIGIYNPTTNTFSTTGTTPGIEAYIGGLLLPDGRVVFVPTNATSIGIYNPTTNTFSTTGTTPGSVAYYGGVLLPDGRVVFVPCVATTIGIFNPSTNAYSTIAGAPGNYAYAGGVLLPDGRVVFVPLNVSTIGIFNPSTNAYSTIAIGAPGSNAYIGGVLLPDGRVVFVPYYSTTIGIFNPTTNTYSTIAGAPGGGAYSGGVLMPNGNVLFIPASTTSIGIYNPITNIFFTTGTTPGSYAYSGGVLLPDGRVVFVPFNATSIGIVSTGLTAPREMCLSPYFNKF